MAKYISNAFSINMMDIRNFSLLRIKNIQSSDIPRRVKSVVGHQDTAKLISKILGFEVPFNRTSLTLKEQDVLYVAQYKGPRLPEGATELPEGATIEFLEITFCPGCCGCPGDQCYVCSMMDWLHGE